MINTPVQILLYEGLGATAPAFAHLPMMLAPNGHKLSKREGAVSVGEYRDKGFSAPALLNYLVRFGWSIRGSGGVLVGRARREVRLGSLRAQRWEVRREEALGDLHLRI